MQAVEVTKLSLLIKALEGETTTSVETSLLLFHQRILPSLDNNILCGNSLISPDFYNYEIEFSINIEKRIKSFDWKNGFNDIMKSGGFDCLIGNPPYIDSEEMVKTHKEERIYCSMLYSCAKGNWDLYCVFVEKGIKLLKENGTLGMIIPNKFLSMPYGDYLKQFLSNYNVENITDYSSVPVFISYDRKINVYPIVLIVNKTDEEKNGKYYKINYINESISNDYEMNFEITKNETNWTRKFAKDNLLIDKIIDKSKFLTSHFIIENAASVSDAYKIKEIIKENKSITQNEFKFINTGTIDKYNILWDVEKTQYIKYAYKCPVINKNEFKKLFPNRFKQAISEKLIGAGMIKNLEFVFDNGKVIAGKSTTVILNKSNKYSLKYLLALLNSDLFSFLYRTLNKNNSMSGGYLNVSKKQMENFFFFELDFNDSKQIKTYNEIIKNVEEISLFYIELKSLKLETQKLLLKRRIKTVFEKINNLIYQLYEITPDEIAIIEKNN